MKPQSAVEPRHLFVYGSLVDPACLDGVLGHRHPGERLAARLLGYRRQMKEGFDWPFIVAADGAAVDGILLMDLTPYDLHVLDRYEEVEFGIYQRVPVEVEAWGCGARPIYVRAATYLAGPGLHALAAS